ncbi:MAG: hypothetical protein JSS20_15875 [Proteobacteria bacterium]|nr:hypothetical protein [Pseudomonadota bacterium]
MLAKITPAMSRATKATQSVEELRTQQEEMRTVERYKSDLQTYHAKDPAFADAMRHVLTVQDNLLQAQGVTDPEARKAALFNAERNFVKQSYAANANPAERLVAMAKAYGWAPKPAAPAAPAAPANGKPSAAAKIENINRGMKASASLSNVVSSGGDGLPSAQQIMAMGEEEYAAFIDKMGGDKAFERRYLGRS